MHFLTCIAIICALKEYCNNRQLTFVCLLIILQPSLYSIFMTGRPDYHGVLVFFLVVCMGCMIQLIKNPQAAKWAYIAGAISALAFWFNISPGVFIILPLLVYINLMWVFDQAYFDLIMQRYTTALFIFSAFALLLERGFNNYLVAETDSLSIIFLLFFLLAAIYGQLLKRRFTPSKPFMRLVYSLFAAVIIGLIFFVTYPQIYDGTEIDPLYRQVRTSRIGHHRNVFSFQSAHEIARSVLFAGIAVPTIIWFIYGTIVYFVSKNKSIISDNYVKTTFFLLICLAIYSRYLFTHRYFYYGLLILYIGYAIFCDNLISKIEKKLAASKALKPTRMLCIAIAFTWFFVPVFVFKDNNTNASNSLKTSDLSQIAGFVAEKYNTDRLNILAAPEVGPLILYYTRHNVMSIPNHRCKYGFADWYHIMTADDDTQALEIIKKRQLDLIVYTRYEKSYFSETEKAFVNRLQNNDTITWLRKIELPEQLHEETKIFEINPDQL